MKKYRIRFPSIRVLLFLSFGTFLIITEKEGKGLALGIYCMSCSMFFTGVDEIVEVIKNRNS